MLLLALSCCFKAQNLRNATTKNNIFFPPKREKRKTGKRRKKDMQVKQQCSGGCQGFLEKNTTRSAAQVWRFFFKNPQGLTFTAGKPNCYLCIFFFSGKISLPLNCQNCQNGYLVISKICVVTQIKSKFNCFQGWVVGAVRCFVRRHLLNDLYRLN